MSNRAEVDRLLEMYDTYKTLQRQLDGVASQLAKAKLLKKPLAELQVQHEKLKASVQRVSDDMTFANPVIWMMYKDEAYKDEAHPIRTMHAFRVHCSKPGYICTKRFTFLNEQLLAANLPSLDDESNYPSDTKLADVYASQDLLRVSNNPEFIHNWNAYEYNRVGGVAAKWENFA